MRFEGSALLIIESEAMIGFMKRVYLDNAATTPVDKEVLKIVFETFKKYPGNPSALHREGVEARKVLESARRKIAEIFFAHPDEIIFTSTATESNNLAIMGVVEEARKNGVVKPHIIVSSIEHPAVLEVAKYLKGQGVSVDYLSVDGSGVIDVKELRGLIKPETVLISVMYANNEIGVIEPVREIAKEVRHARKIFNSVYPYFHTDAAQAVNYLNINVAQLGVDLMTVSSGKVYGPRGVALLYVRRGVQMSSLMYGGSHEMRRRPGTEPVSLVVGFARALEIVEKIKEKELVRLEKLRNTLADLLIKKITGSEINGNLAQTLPNILSISVDGCEGEALVIYLDAKGISVSGRSACTSSENGPSHVILALGKAQKEEKGVIRFSLGRDTKRDDIKKVVEELPRIVEFLKSYSVTNTK